VISDADGLEIRNRGEVLPDFAFKAEVFEFLAEDRVAFADDFEAVTGDGAKAAYAEAGAGEGLTVDHGIRKAERFSAGADFVFKEHLEGFDEFELHVLGQAADVVMGLDHLGGLGAGLDDVGIDGALAEKLDAFELSGFFFEYSDEFAADDHALFLGIGYAGELIEEAVDRVHIDEVCAELLTEYVYNLFRFALAEQAVVYVNAGELLSDGFDEHGGYNGGVNAAGEGEKNLAGTDLLS